ncbi:hypothetical protein SAMN04488036_10625 [Shimia haliotis]|uniref:Uncharacterized protein n=1 Tax=Shimia haliotis TaxID=1280847 RepID=A0A1I4FHV5_9RHOB|nr:hypothetical protein SAMN04488036_10625 [Shimia haliotis]
MRGVESVFRDKEDIGSAAVEAVQKTAKGLVVPAAIDDDICDL